MEKSRKIGQKYEEKILEKIKKYTLKKELLGDYLTFRNRPQEGSFLLKRTEKKELVKVPNPIKGTKEGTGEGS